VLSDDDDPLTGVQPLLAYATSSDPDILNLKQAMRACDKKDFLKAMKQEFDSHTKLKHWVFVLRSSLPPGTKVLLPVWAMRRKRRIATGEVYKWKARLNIHGGQQVHGVHYWETYSPMVRWASIRFALALSILNGWYTAQMDFVLAYPQADIEETLYMEVPVHFECEGYARGELVLELHKNLYGQKQAGRVWYKHLSHLLTTVHGFTQSRADECVFYRDGMVLLIYVDDTICVFREKGAGQKLAQELQRSFDITMEGTIEDFLGVKFERRSDGTFSLSQPQLIDSILKDLGLIDGRLKRAKPKRTPAKTSLILRRDTGKLKHSAKWDYRSVIGKLNFLEKSTRPDISYAVHQCARFSIEPKVTHTEAVLRIGMYLLNSRDKGLIMAPKTHSIDCWVDADFAGNWAKECDPIDVDNVRSRSGYIIDYAGVPLIWHSKLQGEIALSTTEAEFYALSTSLRECIPLIALMKEFVAQGLCSSVIAPQVHCRVFEDNSGALEMANNPKYRPRTKHIATKHHHFRQYVERGDIVVVPIPSEDQRADSLTKGTKTELFEAHRLQNQGW